MGFAGLDRRQFLAGGSAAVGYFATLRRLPGQATGATALVKTPSGSLRGESVSGIQVFRGIPFAEAPVGALRFRPPTRAKAWSGERPATRFAPAAMQSGGGAPTSEDCLYLNVWTPEKKPVKPMPVLVWIHGGGFTGGNSFSATTDGAKFAQNGVVCVSIAYRLGVFGFLDVSPVLDASYAGSANNGLRDAMMALEWVRDNIAAFGGDPSQVTVGGQSAGAKLTDILAGIPAAQGLFHQMVSESGGAERVNPLAAAEAVATGFGVLWDKRSTQSIKTAPAKDLIDGQVAFIGGWPQHFPLRAEVDGTLIPQLPVRTIEAGASGGKALLIGTNREESASFIGPHPKQDPTAGDLGNTDLSRFDAIFKKYAALYPKLSPEELRIRAVTAEEYWVPSIRMADAHMKGGGRVWMYELTLKDPVGKLQGYARHTLELGLVWGKPEVPEETALSTELHQAWVSFLKGQTPSAAGLPAWPEYNSTDRPTMMIDLNCRVEIRPQEAELRLWDGFLA